MKNKNILITNDDGYDSVGIKILENYFSKIKSNYKIVAPLEQRSGASSSITIYGKLKVSKINSSCFAVDGTPVDCVKFGLKNIFPTKPNLVVSGINKGDNSGFSVLYSGTIGAVFESTMQNINSVAFSLFTDAKNEIEFNVEALEKMVSHFFKDEYSGGFVTVNFPHCEYEDFKGFKWVKLSTSTFVEKYTEIEDGIYEIGLDYYREEEGSETTLLKDNWATITPLKVDLTDFSKL